MKKIGYLVCCFAIFGMLAGCVATGGSASDRANQQADQMMYQQVRYANVARKGPTLIVIPGKIKSANATFTQKYTANNIADFGEIELGKANFRVLERSDLGPMLNEVSLAVNMGNPNALKKFKQGRFKTTKWFVRFDVLKAEPVAKAGGGFRGGTAGALLGTMLGGKLGRVASIGTSSVRTSDKAGVWIVGMRYKIMDANTTEQVASNYFEEKMELGAQGMSVMGVSSANSSGLTLDSLVQRLIQKAVADMDAKK